ncbi:glycosyltransferase family 2 protein [Devosia sp. SL43]|uniref:glycosyltransferase family 2 protein n=1 Tax=Devosia sp. SL43 TaxID=2806348 RepID=UPI001F308762|nr:glycosyltransferase family 2 protein [Devosia sp. SL43]UJW85864.1 glycosyltransferase family 2 protein [Devosia sp. SL43]
MTFNPNLPKLRDLLAALAGQVDGGIVVDNGSEHDPAAALGRGTLCISLRENVGIAQAQNLAIHEARKQGCDYVILFDQDSLPPPGMISTLVAIAEQKRLAGELVAAIGPAYIDQRLGKPSRFLRTHGWSSSLQTREVGETVVVDHLIASGCLIPMQALDRVGGMRAELFIDYVDTEWSLRAEHQHGLLSYGTFTTTLDHELGDRPIEAFGQRYAIHPPLRHYYLFRNSVWLWRQPWLPIRWKVARGPKLLLRLGFVAVFGKPPFSQWRMIAQGLRDGFVGKMGKYEDR